MRAVGHPELYSGFGARLCDRCLAEGRGHVTMRPFVGRYMDEDAAHLVFDCPRCGHGTLESSSIPLEMLSRPSVDLLRLRDMPRPA